MNNRYDFANAAWIAVSTGGFREVLIIRGMIFYVNILANSNLLFKTISDINQGTKWGLVMIKPEMKISCNCNFKFEFLVNSKKILCQCSVYPCDAAVKYPVLLEFYKSPCLIAYKTFSLL